MFWLTIIFFVTFCIVLAAAAAQLIRQKKNTLAKAVASTGGVYALLFLCVLIFRLPVPYWALLLTMGAAFVSAFFGQYRQVYFRSRVFDRYVHACGAFSFALLGYYLLGGLLQMGGSALFLAVFTFCLGNTLGVCFELTEFSYDQKPDAEIKNQHGLKDTDTDMLFNLLGSLAAGVGVYFWG